MDNNGFFDWFYLKAETSKIYGEYCKKLYGQDLRQFSQVSKNQYDKIMEFLSPKESDRILDIGCGLGRVIESVHDHYGSYCVGFDKSKAAIDLARRRTGLKVERLKFYEADLNNFNLTEAGFTKAMSLDTLSFTKEGVSQFERLRPYLSRDSKCIFIGSQNINCSSYSSAKEAFEYQPVPRYLKTNKLFFEIIDLSEEQKDFWDFAEDIIFDMRKDFKAADEMELFNEVFDDTRSFVKTVGSGRYRRFMLVFDLCG